MTTTRYTQQALARYRIDIEAARDLLAFAVSNGRAVDDRILAAILRAEDLSSSLLLPAPEERVAFESAYRDLAALLSPVTLDTLHATSSAYPCKSIFALWWPTSEAKVWSRKLWFIAFIVLGLILYMQECVTDTVVLDRYQPFLYGALGALTYLLRACHEYIHRRDFDRRRIPEYYNRLLLGIVAGGAILLFPLPKEPVPNAIAFLAGYNTDLLFSTLERIANAVFPKIGGDRATDATTAESATKASAPSTPPAGAASEERVQRIQKFLSETERPKYDPGSVEGVWDERTRSAIVAFLESNYEAIPAFQAAAMTPDFDAMDKEALIAQMSLFIMPQTAQAA